MKSSLAVLVISLVASASASALPQSEDHALQSRQVTIVGGAWCNRGTNGDGSCEARDRWTFCCSNSGKREGEFQHWKEGKDMFYQLSQDPNGPNQSCSGGTGWIQCAK